MLNRGVALASVRAAWSGISRTVIVGVAWIMESYPFGDARVNPGPAPAPPPRRFIGGGQRAAARARDPLRARSRGEPRHAGLPDEQALARREGRLRRGRDPARHPRRALDVDEDDLYGGA